jgi:hypothetical protein
MMPPDGQGMTRPGTAREGAAFSVRDVWIPRARFRTWRRRPASLAAPARIPAGGFLILDPCPLRIVIETVRMPESLTGETTGSGVNGTGGFHRGSHPACRLVAHPVFVTDYRRKLFEGHIAELNEISLDICAAMGQDRWRWTGNRIMSVCRRIILLPRDPAVGGQAQWASGRRPPAGHPGIPGRYGSAGPWPAVGVSRRFLRRRPGIRRRETYRESGPSGK